MLYQMERKHRKWIRPGALLLPALLWAAPAPASIEPIIPPPETEVLEQQRKLFTDASKHLARGDLKRFTRLRDQLTDYPLYPYLLYSHMRRYLSSTSLQQVQDFATRYADTPLPKRLRQAWLKSRFEHGAYEDVIAGASPINDTTQECRYRRALYKSGRRDAALEDMETLWLVGKSQPKMCDPLFTAWRDSGGLTSDLAWQRMVLAMNGGQITLARYLKRFMEGDDRYWAEQWLTVRRHPEAVLERKRFSKEHPYRHRILLYGVERQAVFDAGKARDLLPKLRKHYAFAPDELARASRAIALGMAKQGHDDALDTLRAYSPEADDLHFQIWRLRAALRAQDWPLVLEWIDVLPEAERSSDDWRYWRGRALTATGNATEARKLFAGLSLSSGYYGLLAGRELGIAPVFRPDVPADRDTAQRFFRTHSGAQRAHELYRLGRTIEARREWRELLKGLNEADLLAAAALAHDWGWHDRAIVALGKTRYRNHYDQRFPTPWQGLVERYADKRDLDQAWVYAIMRQESAFMSDVRSSAGALGLMQLMPATAKQVARQTRTRLRNNSQILDPDTNIKLGTQYLRDMLDRFGSPILASAAYNAGPHRVDRWLPSDCPTASDIWIELIPFNETRDYVKRMVAYTAIYAHRLGRADAQLVIAAYPSVKDGDTGKVQFACAGDHGPAVAALDIFAQPPLSM